MLDCLLLLHCTKLSAVSVVETVSKLKLAAAGTELSSLCCSNVLDSNHNGVLIVA